MQERVQIQKRGTITINPDNTVEFKGFEIVILDDADNPVSEQEMAMVVVSMVGLELFEAFEAEPASAIKYGQEGAVQ